MLNKILPIREGDKFFTPDTYPQRFKAGDLARVRLCKESLAQKPEVPDDEYLKYPLQDYEGKVVQVVSRAEDEDNTRTTFPDNEGLVECYLPFSFSYITKYVDDAGRMRKRKHTSFKLPILYSCL